MAVAGALGVEGHLAAVQERRRRARPCIGAPKWPSAGGWGCSIGRARPRDHGARDPGGRTRQVQSGAGSFDASAAAVFAVSDGRLVCHGSVPRVVYPRFVAGVVAAVAGTGLARTPVSRTPVATGRGGSGGASAAGRETRRDDEDRPGRRGFEISHRSTPSGTGRIVPRNGARGNASARKRTFATSPASGTRRAARRALATRRTRRGRSRRARRTGVPEPTPATARR